MSLSTEALFAALAEGVYQRALEDVPIDYQSLLPGFAAVPFAANQLQPKGLVASTVNGSGMIYSAAGTGFAAQVLRDDATGSYVVVFRGTDWGTTIDTKDIVNDISIGTGNLIGGQVTDALNLMNLVLAQAGSPSNVTIAGQSLGGGLAILMGSIYGIETYAYDPAPFGKALWTLAGVEATASGGQETQKSIYEGYLQNLSAMVHAYRVDHEVLSSSSNTPSVLVAAGSVAFDSPAMYAPLGLNAAAGPITVQVSHAGFGDGSFNDAMALHHPSLMALLLKDPTFGDLTQSDAAIRRALWDNGQIIAGPKDNPRSDPDPDHPIPLLAGGFATITSWVEGGAPQSGTLYRALWLDDDFRATFKQAFADIQHGAAGIGLSSNNKDFYPSQGSIHQSLVELGLRVVRDGIHSLDEDGSVASAAARYIFDGVHNEQGVEVPNGNYAVVRLGDIIVQSADDKAQIDSARTVIDNAFMSRIWMDWQAPTFGWSSLDQFEKPTLPWKVLVVQDAGNDVSMNYAPTTEVENLRHVIFGGKGHLVTNEDGTQTRIGDTIQASAAGDYIVGGDGDDIFILGNGYEAGDGNGSFIIAGKGYDTIDYSNVRVSVNYGDVNYSNPSEVVSTDPAGIRHDVVSGAESVIGPRDGDLVNYFNFNQTHGLQEQARSLTLYAGTNYITGTGGGAITIDGQGGYNVLRLSSTRQDYTFEKTDYGWQIEYWYMIPHHIVDHHQFDWNIRGVQMITFEGGSSPMVLAHQGEDRGSMSIYSATASGLNPNTTYDLTDNDSNHHTVTVQYYGTNSSHGILTATILQETSESNTLKPDGTVVVTHNPGQFVLNYTPDPTAKYNESEYYGVTITNEHGKAYTFYVNETSPGSAAAPTAVLDQSASVATVSEPMVHGANNLASATGTISISDSDQTDIETAHSVFLSSSGSSMPMGEFSAKVVQDSNGNQQVEWIYHVEDDAFSWMPFGTTIQETYQVWITDQHGGRSLPKNVVVNINAKSTATTQIGASDVAGTVVQSADADGIQVVSGKIVLSDVDLKEMRSVSFKETGGLDRGVFQTSFSDTTGTGTGELTWQYFIRNSDLSQQGNFVRNFDIVISDGRGGTVDQNVTITGYAFNSAASPVLSAPGTLAVTSGQSTPGSETGSFTDSNFTAHHSISATLLGPAGSAYGQLIATIDHDTFGPNAGIGRYTLAYTTDPVAAAALQDGQPHVEQWTIAIVGDNGKIGTQTVTVVVGRVNQTAVDSSVSTTSGSLVADTDATPNETSNGSIFFVDPDKSDAHVVSATFVSSDAGTTPMGSLFSTLAADTTAATAPGRVDWEYQAADSDLDLIPDGQTVHEVWAIAIEDGHGGTTLQNITISLSKTPPNAPPIVSTSTSDVFAQISEAAGATSSTSHRQASGVIAFADPDSGDAPVATVVSISAVYFDASGSVAQLTAPQQAMVSAAFSVAPAPGNAQTGAVTWTFSAADSNLDFLSRGEKIQVTAVVRLDDGHGHSVDTPVSVSISGTDDAPAVTLLDVGAVAEDGNVVTIDLLESSSDPDRADTLHLASVPIVTSSDGHAVAGSLSGQEFTIDPAQFAYLGRNDQATLTIQFSVSDGQIASPGSATLVVTGTNQAPQITAGDELHLDQNAGSTDINLLASASDIDSSDVLALAPNSVTISSSDGHQVQFSQTIEGIQFDPSQFAYLLEGEVVDLTVNYAVSDGAATTAGQQMIAIAGTEDAPLVTPISVDSATEGDAVRSIDLLQGASDPDHGATLSIVPQSVKVTSSDGHQAGVSLSGSILALDPWQFRYLHAGESTSVTVDYDVTDGIATVHNTATLTVTGTDGVPAISPINAGSVNQNDPVKIVDLLQTADDPDGKDTVMVMPWPTVTASDGRFVNYWQSGNLVRIDPSQFAYLKGGQSNVITINYDVTDGQTTLHNSATLTVIGEDDGAVAPARTLTGTTPAPGTYSFNGLTGIATPDQGTYSYSIVAGSVSATSNDGHAVVVGNVAGSATITLDPTQFKYLAAGESATVTFGYDVAISGSTLSPTHATATLRVMGTNDAPAIPTPSSIAIADTALQDAFASTSGTIAATDPDQDDVQFWTTFNQSLASATIIGANGAAIIRPNGSFTIIPSSQKINALRTGSSTEQYAAQIDDGHGGLANKAISVTYTAANDTPSSAYFNTGGAVLEHAANGTLVGTLKVVDPDTGDTVTWSMIDNAGGRFALVAVGTRISPRPPHRSRRALLTHRAPPSGQTSCDERFKRARRAARSHYSDRRGISALCPNRGRLTAVPLG